MNPQQVAKLIDEIQPWLKEVFQGNAAADVADDAAELAITADRRHRECRRNRPRLQRPCRSRLWRFRQAPGCQQRGARRQARRHDGRGRARLGLVGKPLTLEGTTVEGKPFDWAKYKGKIVLVDFWATWCGPCRKLVNIEKNYEAYHGRGFDVVGISVDRDRGELDKYLKETSTPGPSFTTRRGASRWATIMASSAFPPCGWSAATAR